MGIKNNDHTRKSAHRASFTVPGVSGNYANERMTFGAVGAGEVEQSFMGVTVLCEGAVASATVELWLPQVCSDGAVLPENRTDANYFYSGQSSGSTALTTGQSLAFTFALAGWPGGQIRVKSGGVQGPMSVSMVAF